MACVRFGPVSGLTRCICTGSLPLRMLKEKGTVKSARKQIEFEGVLDWYVIAMERAQLDKGHYLTGALRLTVIDGDVEIGDPMAGRVPGMLGAEGPIADTIGKPVAQGETALKRR